MNKTLLNFFTRGFFIVLIFFCLSPVLSAQWSSDPSVNLQICDLNGEQNLPKVVSTSDDGCYISWFDSRNGSYAVYLQRLNHLGEKAWDVNGLLISNNPQNSSLVDYDLGIDNQNNAIVTFTDIRDNDSLHAFGYLIDPSGNFLWGPNGIRLSGVGDFQANPVTTQTSDGNYLFSWIVFTDTQKIALQKISPAGQKLWGANPIIYASGTDEQYTYPAVIPSDNGSVIVIHTGFTGPFYAATVHIYAQKFDADGNPMWGSNGVVIQNLGEIPFYEHPAVISDKDNGAFVAWYDDRDANNLFSSFVQHITSSGTVTFTTDGAEVSTLGSMHHISASLAFHQNTNELFAFWLEETPNQDQFAVYGQKFDASGNRQWTTNGYSFTTQSPNAMFGPFAVPTDTSVYVMYLEGNMSGVNQGIKAFMVNSSGSFSWNPSIVTMSDPSPEKLHEVVTISSDQIAKIVWEDTRIDRGIYAQNINPDGQLGNIIIPVELTSFSAAVDENNVLLNWKTSTETNNKGFDVERSRQYAIGSRQNENGEWEKIGFAEGNGTTTEPKAYSFTDSNVPSGKYFYRLKQINFDGSFEYSKEVEVEVSVPNEFSLSQNYPNPFNPSTLIKYSVPGDGYVSLKIFNALGQEVAVLVNGIVKSGSHEVIFSATNLSSGVYYYRIESDNKVLVKKMLVIK